MGAFFNSICMAGEQPADVRAALERWLAVRGFRISQEPPLFDLDIESERSAFLVWNERWTILFFSQWEEERRLIRELQSQLAPLLYLWVHDSDIWGWDLFGPHGFLSSYSSDPRDTVSFGTEAAGEERPAADPSLLVAELGLPTEQAQAIERIQRQSAAFKEDICRQLCELLELGPALASYDELETGALDDRLDGWQSAQWMYFHLDAARASFDGELDLHALELDEAHRVSVYGPRPVELSPELLAEMEEMRRRARRTLLLLRPISWLAGGWRRLRSALRKPKSPARPGSGPDPSAAPEEPAPVIDVKRTESARRHQVINRRHAVRMLLPQGVEPLEVSGKPASVTSFRAGRTVVTCTARRLRHLSEVLRPPSRSTVERDRRYRVGGLPARHVLFRMPASRFTPSTEPRFLSLHVVQTHRALYVFLYRYDSAIDPWEEAAIEAAVASFRAEEAGRRTD